MVSASEALRTRIVTWPAHLASVRARVFDHVDPSTLGNAAQALSEIAKQLEDRR